MSSDSEYSESDEELQTAFAKGLLKPGLNVVEKAPKQFTNNTKGLREKLNGFKSKLPWIELLDLTNEPAPLAPELAAQMEDNEKKRENQLKNNKKLPRPDPAVDPIINDFKREMMFYRQAQAAVLEGIPRLKAMGLPTKRPDDYFAEMAKSDAHMQKIRENLMKKQLLQQKSEKVKQLRIQRKEGKALQVQVKLQRQQEKKEILDRVKKVRKGVSKNLDFLEKPSDKKGVGKGKKAQEKRKWRNDKYGFGGRKRGSKVNTRDSSADVRDYKGFGGKPKPGKKNNLKQQRPGKNKRIKRKGRK